MPQHGHDDQPLEDVIEPDFTITPEMTDEEVAATRQAHRDYEASKLTGVARTRHELVRALTARGFAVEERPDEGTYSVTDPSGTEISLTIR